ncbi:MAG: FMN-binding protein, partial [Porphyromonas sp.]|nr:FMN-binding protein [Porphyromonas sp.]
DGERKYVLGMSGNGLWGPIWGYIALEDDGDTVYGVNLSHASETPGLGAEITAPHFTNQFAPNPREEKGLEPLHIFKDGSFKSIRVVKGKRTPMDGADYVDGISGGTITSKGVDAMIEDNIKRYVPFLEKLNSQEIK